MDFGEKLSPTAVISSILSSYPFSVGLLRELLQNSDDAKASKQIFVLDLRTHPTDTLYHHELADAQGPALLACNDALFSDGDWEAVQTIYQSSKITDTSKIGKYGVGFRSCYHVTDNPQILSGSRLAIFDPHHAFTSSGGATFDFVEQPNKHADQLSGFDFFIPMANRNEPFSKTIIRLPLRTTVGAARSLIKRNSVEPSKIRQLFEDFIKEEIDIVLLFLTHISSVEIYEVDDQGITCLASVELVKSASDWQDANITTYRSNVEVTTDIFGSISQSWRVLCASYPDSEAATILSERLGYDVDSALKRQKLVPNIAIAMPLPLPSSTPSGRLYTYLPLPLSTGFRCHIHGLFALTPDRQHLRNGEETGVVKGDDSVIVAWNRLLFDTFIPSAWAMLLPILLDKDNLTSIFDAWPLSRPAVQGGDTMYWNDLPCKVVSAIARYKLAVWPIIAPSKSGQTQPMFSDLGSLIVASETDNQETLAALAMAGVNITQPPAYIKDLLGDAGVDFDLLTPFTAHRALLRSESRVSEPAAINLILSYLLSEGDLTNIIGLPLVRTLNGMHVALTKSSDDASAHILLTKSDVITFGDYDDGHAIDVTQFPFDVEELLLRNGPAILDVNSLTNEQVIRYLVTFWDRSLESSPIVDVPDAVIDWLVLFWKWHATWRYRSTLFPSIRLCYLVPTSRSALVPPTHGVFDLDPNLDTTVLEALEAVGILFLHPKITSGARLFLAEQDIIKSVTNGHDILDHISDDCAYSIKSNAARAFRGHLLSCLENSRRLGPLNAGQQRKLRRLPIYPIFVPPMSKTNDNNAIREIRPITDGQTIKSVVDISLIPVINDTVFLDGCRKLLEYLQVDGELLDANGVLSLAVDHLAQQPKHLQRAFIEQIIRDHDTVSSGLLRRLSATSFVAVYGDDISARAPKDVFDPQCAVATLLLNDCRLPCLSDDDDRAIVAALRSLQLLRSTLTNDLIEERIAYISKYSGAQESINLSMRLIHLIVDSNHDCSGLYIDPNLKWLPTNAGLLGSQDSHHSDAHPSDLFDQILPMLAVGKVSTSLVEALAWSESLPLSVVKGQLEKVLQHGQGHQKLQLLIQELSTRVDLSSQDEDDLRVLTSDRPWVPISQRCIVSTSHAVLSSDVDIPPGFYMVPFSLSDDHRMRQFLQLMGCSERPSSNALLHELHSLTHRESDLDTIKISLRLLEALMETAMSDEERTRLLVPDANCHLRPIALVYYNDLGPPACFVSLPDFVSVAHQSLPFELAKGLGMTFIGHSGLKSLLIDDHDMGEALTSRIRSVLVQYTVEQAFTEFLANAADAKATTFGILLDDQYSAASSHLLSPEFADIQSRPSLIIYNNSIFDDKDFNGIRNVGVGGKVGKSNAIGQFGLGALSMYHFTEVAMIVSGDRVMFLDPSKSYLPFAGRASASMTLSDIRRLYPDHLAPLCGLYNFSLDMDYYPGSLFRLPLREGESLLSPHSFTMHDLKRLVNGHYLNIAPQTLLFTQVDTVKAEHRDAQGCRSQYWVIQGSRSQFYRDGCYESQTLCISASQGSTGDGQWQILSYEEGILPSQFHHLVDKHRLRNPIRVGLAANLTSHNPHHNFFATMPLPIGSNLPVQLNAPFILSPDRRSIRLDGEEAKYNLWLLSQLAPPLYLRLLEELLSRRDLTDPTWWRWWPHFAPDVMSSALVNSLYSQYIATTDHRICVSVVNSTISPGDAVFLIDADSAAAKLLLHLRPSNLVKPPSYIRRALSKQISTVDKDYVKQVILQNVDCVRAAYVEGQFTVRDIKGVVRFLLEDSRNAENVVSLPLLPLANKTLATFGPSSNKRCYYAIPGQTLSIFPSDRFVDPQFSITAIGVGLNVSRFNASAAQDLIKDRIPVTPQRDDTGAEDRCWIDTFWTEFQRMDLKSESISMFPLVPTATQDAYISLHMCDTDGVIAMGDSASEQELAPILTRLGAIIVWKDQQHASLRNVLRDRRFQRFNIDSVLRFLKTIKFSVPNRFTRLSGSEHSQFAQWGRENIMETSKDLDPVARSLPIWTALGVGMEGRFFAASDITMMPAAIYRDLADVLPFLQVGPRFVEYSSTLYHKFKVELLSFTQFRDRLNISRSTIVDADDMAPYRNLLKIIIANHFYDRRDVLVPNSNRVLDYSADLYARSLPLFRETFQTPRYLDRLVHQDFLGLENGLGQFHLRTQMDFASFKECVRVIHDDIYGDRRVERATLLYQWYCTQLPIRLADSSPHFWRELDLFRFIPPVARGRSASYNQSLYVCRPILDPELVSPREVLRFEHEAIAWTQRASFIPSEKLLLADLSLGVPDPVEVLEHLRVLSLQIAPSYPSNTELLSDIKQTYQWLEKHKEDADLKNRLVQYHTEPLFLNVDDPERIDWTWHSASKLYINISDAPASDCWGVRQFLMPFRGLLRLAGVKEVQMRTAPDMPISSLEQQLNELKLTRNTYDSMRRERKLTDVIFITDDGEEFPVHRVVLAAAGEHFRDLFLGQWGESNRILNKPISVPECPADCLRWILEYLYTGVIMDIKEQDMLLHILRLSHRWELPSLVEVMQIKLVEYISLDTYDTLREEAEKLDAGILANNCNMFEKDNQGAIRRFKGH